MINLRGFNLPANRDDFIVIYGFYSLFIFARNDAFFDP